MRNPIGATTTASPAASPPCGSASRCSISGARTNLAKTLLYAINGGRDELSGDQIGPTTPAPVSGDVLDVEEVKAKLLPMMDWLAKGLCRRPPSARSLHCMASTCTNGSR